MKTCSKCKQTKPLEGFHNHTRTKDKKQHQCKICINAYSKTEASKKAVKRYQTSNWRGVASLIRAHMKSNSKKRGQHWDDSWWTVDSVLAKIEGGKCEKTGLPFEIREENERHKKRAFIPSPDRIDNSKGYEPDNVQWVLFIYNMMKNNFDDADVAHFLLSLKYLEDFKDIKDFKETL
jgi:hypothetical protein